MRVNEIGYLLNFGYVVLKNGITHRMNGLEEEMPLSNGELF